MAVALCAAQLAVPLPGVAESTSRTDQVIEVVDERDQIAIEAVEAEFQPEEIAHFDPSPTAFDDLTDPDGTSIFPFAFAGNMPQLDQHAKDAIAAALTPYEENDVDAGFLLMDLETGRGFARNIDTDIYGASSFKGPLCAYVCSRVDADDYALSEHIGSGSLSEDGSSFSINGSDTISDLISETIRYSSNDAFGSLRATFNRSTVAGWLESIGVDGECAYDSWFPSFTVRDAARMWVYTYELLESETDTASFLSNEFSSTETSFMRDGLKRSQDRIEVVHLTETISLSDDGAEATTLAAPSQGDILVRSKAGWNADDDPDDCSISESGIVTCDGRDYLLCVMTGACYSEENAVHMGDLAAAVFATHSALS